MALRAPVLNLMLDRGETSRLVNRSSRNNSPSRMSMGSYDTSPRHSRNDLSLERDEEGMDGILYSPVHSLIPVENRAGVNALVASSFASLNIEPSLKLKIRITEKRENEEGSIYYKDDKDRFSQQYTVKLKTFSEYNVVVEVKPPRKLLFVKIGDLKYDTFSKTADTEKSKQDTYSFIWSTNRIRTTKRKHRSILPCVVKFDHSSEIKFDMFVKFYFSCEVAHYNGTPLSFIELNYETGKRNSSSFMRFT